MRHSVVCFAVLPEFFLFSIFTFAQHSGGGGGGASSGGGGASVSSASGGSSFHGGFSGGGSTASSGGSHSSGASHGSGSASHGSAFHGSGSRSGSNGSSTHSSALSTLHHGVQSKTAQPKDRAIFVTLWHWFRKPEPKEGVELRRRICPNGQCPIICAPGSAGQQFGCATLRSHNSCTHRQVWNGGACLYQTPFLDDCDRFLMEMLRQQQIAAEAETVRQNACAGGVSQECYMASADAQNQAAIYQTYLDRYRQCRNRTLNTLPFGEYSYLGFSNAFMMEALSAGLQ